MSNINDYLKWRGDISLKYDELNEIDELILARYSYFPFFKIEMKSEETIRDISKKCLILQMMNTIILETGR